METSSRKKHLIHTAIKIIDELGFQGLTTKELSLRENISEAAIYRHFRSKNEIIQGVLNYHRSIFEKIREESREVEEKSGTLAALDKLMESYLDIYESHPALTAILNSYEALSKNSEFAGFIETVMHIRLSSYTQLFQRGIDRGELNGILHAESIAYILIGTMSSVTLNWRIQNYSFPLKEKVLDITEQLKRLMIAEPNTSLDSL